jgi:hypothetical protein
LGGDRIAGAVRVGHSFTGAVGFLKAAETAFDTREDGVLKLLADSVSGFGGGLGIPDSGALDGLEALTERGGSLLRDGFLLLHRTHRTLQRGDLTLHALGGGAARVGALGNQQRSNDKQHRER